MRHAHGNPARGETRGRRGLREAASDSARPSGITRRNLLKGAGALVVIMAAPESFAQGAGSVAKPVLAPTELDSWIAVRQDGGITAFFGKMDMGQGVDVAIRQIVADELDVAVERVAIVMGDTALTVN